MKIKLDLGAFRPEKAHSTDAGYDIRTPFEVLIGPHSSAIVNTGVHIQLPKGKVGFLKSKSGLNVKYGITSEGVIDEGYTGAIVCKLYNNSDAPYKFCVGDKITQLVILDYYSVEIDEVDELDASERGNAGFGSSGK